MKPIISKNIRVRYPELFEVGDDSIIDDFSYFSTKVQVGRGSHVANNCSVAGGQVRLFKLGDYSTVSAGVRIWCTSDDFNNDLSLPLPEGISPIGNHPETGDVIIGNFTAIGSGSVVLPDNHIPEGTAIGAMSLVPPRFQFDPWSVYAGIPIRYRGPRNRERIATQIAKLDAYYKICRS
jgi:acetyltransferase-like isoleucine patch superfamily enzyme